MRREDVKELHSLMPIGNIKSVMIHGIVCHELAEKLAHISVALEDVQERREVRRVPGGRLLHEYANLYFCARNPMMYKRRAQHPALCVLSIKPTVLDLDGVIITDGNAASQYTYFGQPTEGMVKIEENIVFAESWTDSDPIQYSKKKRLKCAEVLVPDQVPASFIAGAYVSNPESARMLMDTGFQLPVKINPHLFFVK